MYCRSLNARFLFVIAFAMALSGCVTKAGWQYQPGPAQVAPTRVPLSVGVLQFQDQRATDNSTYFWLCIIPAVPYCTADYHRLESANGFLTAASYSFRPGEDLAQATAIELRQIGLFRDVFVTDRHRSRRAIAAPRNDRQHRLGRHALQLSARPVWPPVVSLRPAVRLRTGHSQAEAGIG